MKKKKPRFVKSPEDHTPLPNPFSLPTHYREDVERCLKSGSMTQQTKRAFFTAVAGAMLTFKRYPSSQDYHCVYRSIIAKYPFLEATAGSQEVLILYCNVQIAVYCSVCVYLGFGRFGGKQVCVPYM